MVARPDLPALLMFAHLKASLFREARACAVPTQKGAKCGGTFLIHEACQRTWSEFVSEVLMATFANREYALSAVRDLLDAGFLNVSQEQDGASSLVIVDADRRAAEARAILERHGQML
jgi:hypothetical protein